MDRRNLLLLVIVLCWVSEGSTVPLLDFFPFGTTSLYPGNDESATITLRKPIAFYGRERTHITVHTDGKLHLMEALNSPSFASVYAYAADADTSEIGTVFYQETQDPSLLQRATDIICVAFPKSGCTISSLFITTWFYVGYFYQHDNKVNTYQCILAVDAVSGASYAILFYADDMMEWTTGDEDGGMDGLGGSPAVVGFVSGSEEGSHFFGDSNTSSVITIDTTGNFNIRGLWLYRIDGTRMEYPSINECETSVDNCHSNAHCIDLPEGFMCICKDGYFGNGVKCISKELDYNTQNRDLRQAGAASGSGIILVEFEQQQYTVPEDNDTVTVCVTVTNPMGLNDTDNYTITFMAESSTGTAQGAGIDYRSDAVELNITNTAVRQCISVSIIDDSIVEADETFQVKVLTLDSGVEFVGDVDSALVVIIDNDDVTIGFEFANYTAVEGSSNSSVCIGANTTLERPVQFVVSTDRLLCEAEISGIDFSSQSAMLWFDQTNFMELICLNATIIEDSNVEDSERFIIRLSSSDPAVQFSLGTTALTIVDNDVPEVSTVTVSMVSTVTETATIAPSTVAVTVCPTAVESSIVTPTCSCPPIITPPPAPTCSCPPVPSCTSPPLSNCTCPPNLSSWMVAGSVLTPLFFLALIAVAVLAVVIGILIRSLKRTKFAFSAPNTRSARASRTYGNPANDLKLKL